MRKGLTHPVYLIADFQHSGPPPTGAVLHVRRALLLAPKNIGLIVVAGGGSFVNGLVSVLCMIPELQSQKFATTSTLDAARTLVASERV